MNVDSMSKQIIVIYMRLSSDLCKSGLSKIMYYVNSRLTYFKLQKFLFQYRVSHRNIFQEQTIKNSRFSFQQVYIEYYKKPGTTYQQARKGRLTLEGLIDADQTTNLDSRKNISAYIFTLAGAAVAWSCEV